MQKKSQSSGVAADKKRHALNYLSGVAVASGSSFWGFTGPLAGECTVDGSQQSWHDLFSQASTAQECKDLCQSESDCDAFTFTTYI